MLLANCILQMLRTKYILTLLTVAALTVTASSQAPSYLSNRSSNTSECYGSGYVPDVYQFWEEVFPVYDGVYTDTLGYVKSIALNTTTLGRIQLNVVTDTLKTTDYTWKTFEYKELVKKGKVSASRRVVCDQNQTRKLFKKVQKAMQKRRFGKRLEASGIISDEWKEVMKDYLASIDLELTTLGFYDIEVLETLGIKTRRL